MSQAVALSFSFASFEASPPCCSEELAVEHGEVRRREGVEQRLVRVLQDDVDGLAVDELDAVDVRDVLRRLVLDVEDAVERPFHVLGRHRVAGRELDVLADREAPALAVRRALPFRRHHRLEVDVVAGLHRDERLVGGLQRHRRRVGGLAGGIEGDRVADVDADHERGLRRLRHDAARQPGRDRGAADAEELCHLATADPALLVHHRPPGCCRVLSLCRSAAARLVIPDHRVKPPVSRDP